LGSHNHALYFAAPGPQKGQEKFWVLEQEMAAPEELAVGKKILVESVSADLTTLSERHSPTAAEVQPEPAFIVNWRRRAQRLQKEAHVFYFVLRHPRARWHARLVAACTAAYLFSPIQLIPSYIPVIGILDDLLVVFLGVKLLQKITPPDVLSECRRLADALQVRRKDKIRVVAAVAIATVWFLLAVSGSVLMMAYIRH
jgi:uncharacterized membrane protein YkvA (DUF1232 family)